MSCKTYGEADGSVSDLRGRPVAVLGFGTQGHAHALNLRDSGIEVIVGQRKGAGYDRAAQAGFAPLSLREATRRADLVVVALPDETAAQVYEEQIAPELSPGKTLGFLHGFNITFGLIAPPAGVDVIMISPKGPGKLLRSTFVEGIGLPALMAVQADVSGRARQTALAWAAGIGSLRAAVYETTFRAETEADLFGEQAVLCGGMSALVKAGFQTLVEAGYEPEIAYFECVHELKQITDLLYAGGLSYMRECISNTAEYGDLTRGPRVIDESVRARMREILDEVRSGTFAREWLAESRAGRPRFRELFEADRDSLLERVGERLRRQMPWLGEP